MHNPTNPENEYEQHVYEVTFENDAVVPTVGFDYAAVDRALSRTSTGDEEEEKKVRQELVVRLFGLLCGRNASPKEIGQRVLVIAHIIKASDTKTQADLAKRMGVGPARVSQILNTAKAGYDSIYQAFREFLAGGN